MNYSTDIAYLDYFRNAAEGMHDSNPIEDRLKSLGFAAGTTILGALRTAGRVVKIVVEIAKVVFYFLASLFTLGNYGNADRLKDHCKLLILNLGALVAQPLQVMIHLIAMAIGIVGPKSAYRAMQIGTAPLAWITSYENEIEQQYKTPKIYAQVTEALTSKITSLFNRCSFAVQVTMKTVVSEFSCARDAALVAPIGYMDEFHSFGANPKTLTEEQKKLTPILLLNGNYSHQGTFLPLLYALKLSNSKRPVYTINLPPHMTDPAFIAAKIEAIKRQYGKVDLEMDVVAHSMGSNLLQNICSSNEEQAFQIRRAITIGTPFHSQEIAAKVKAAYDILGAKDCLTEAQSILPQGFQTTLQTGHIGLLFNSESLNAMIKWLANP